MEVKTLSTLRSLVRFYADERQVGYIADSSTSIDMPINAKIRATRAWVLGRPGGRSFWSLRETFPLISGTASYKIDGTDTTNGTDWQADSVGEVSLQWSTTQVERVDNLPDADWEQINSGTWGQRTYKGYRLGATFTGTTWGQALIFAPTPTSATTCLIEYVPSSPVLANATDTVVGPEGFAEAVAIQVAMQIKGMQREDLAYLQNQLQGVMSMMDSAISRRVANYSPKVVDVSPDRRGRGERDLPPA